MPVLPFQHAQKKLIAAWLTGCVYLVSLASVLLVTGCQVSVGKQTRPLVSHTPIHGSVELEAEMNSYKQETPNNDTTRKSLEMRELLRLETEGDVYHSNLFMYDAMIAFGLSQSRFEEDGDVFRDQGVLSEYSFRGRLFSQKNYPSSFYLERSEDVVPRTFGRALDVETESRGFTQSLDVENWPMTFSYNEYLTEQDSSGGASEGRDFFRSDEKNFNYRLDHDFTELSELRFEFDRRDVIQERFNSVLERLEDRYTIRHTHYFDEARRYRFESYFSLLEQSKDFDLEQILWMERLQLRHTDRLETFYNMYYSESNRQQAQNDNTRLESGFRHQLYDSLQTTGRVFRTENNDNAVNEKIRGTDLSFDYTKTNPWGRLQANYFAGFEELERVGGGTTASVINEKHPFTTAGSLRFFLDRRNIDTSTIQVEGESTLKIYNEGADYIVNQIGELTEIQVLLGGEIFSDGDQILLVGYDYLTDPDGEEKSFTQIFMVRQDFDNGLGIYYEYHIRDQDSNITETSFVQDEYVKNILGVDYTKGGLLLEAQYRDEDSTRLPLVSKRVSGSYLWPLDNNNHLNIFASNSWIDYLDEDDENKVSLFSAGVGLLSRLNDRYRITSNIVYRDEDNDRLGETKGFDWNTELRYIFRQFSYSVGVEMSFLEQERNKQKTDNLFVYFRARREF